MATCDKCKGKGLVGNGPEPWLLQGHVATCSACSGTGSIEDETTDVATDEKPLEPEAPAPVDNPPTPKKSGIMSIFRRS